MPRMLFALLSLLALPPGQSAATPPEEVSGTMVFDHVADGLRRYRKEEDVDELIRWLNLLAPTQDPRVGVALGEALSSPSNEVRMRAASLLCKFYLPPGEYDISRRWWKANEADLRRRAKELP